MNGVIRRDCLRYGGAVEAALLGDNITVELICDGLHLPRELIKFVYKVKGAGKTAIITDSMRGAGLPDGIVCRLGGITDGIDVMVRDGVARLPDGSGFAGSVATAEVCLRTAVRLADIPLCDAVRMYTSTPADIIGIGGTKGSLLAGYDADITVFDDSFDIALTISEGVIVYDNITRKP